MFWTQTWRFFHSWYLYFLQKPAIRCHCLGPLLRHARPWSPCALTALPHTQVCGTQALHPSLCATDTQTASSDNGRPTIAIGCVWIQSPVWGDDILLLLCIAAYNQMYRKRMYFKLLRLWIFQTQWHSNWKSLRTRDRTYLAGRCALCRQWDVYSELFSSRLGYSQLWPWWGCFGVLRLITCTIR